MSRRRPTITTDDEPATVPAVVTPVRSDWSDWSQEHERKRLAENVRMTQEAAERPIYPREFAGRIAAASVSPTGVCCDRNPAAC
jgi:hypothetical protein